MNAPLFGMGGPQRVGTGMPGTAVTPVSVSPQVQQLSRGLMSGGMMAGRRDTGPSMPQAPAPAPQPMPQDPRRRV